MTLTLQAWVSRRATWADRLACLFRGHRSSWRPYEWHPMDEAEDRRAHAEARPFCMRCGKELPKA